MLNTKATTTTNETLQKNYIDKFHEVERNNNSETAEKSIRMKNEAQKRITRLQKKNENRLNKLCFKV